MDKKSTRNSKFISLILRHKPETIGLQLDNNGWANINELLRKAQEHGRSISPDDLKYLVEANNKQRFTISEDGKRIRANQGHSLKVDLQLQPVEPPEVLFHGTATRHVASIMKQGLLPSGRHHVHLSADLETAKTVGIRHGKLVVLEVRAGEMQEAGFTFYRSVNGVWLCDHIPAQFLREITA